MKFIQQFQAEIDSRPPSPPPAGLEALDIRQVAGLLRCTVDTARRIPRHKLPAYRVGKRLLFRRAQVLDYLWTQKAAAGDGRADEEISATANDQASYGQAAPFEGPDFNARMRRIRERQV